MNNESLYDTGEIIDIDSLNDTNDSTGSETDGSFHDSPDEGGIVVERAESLPESEVKTRYGRTAIPCRKDCYAYY